MAYSYIYLTNLVTCLNSDPIYFYGYIYIDQFSWIMPGDHVRGHFVLLHVLCNHIVAIQDTHAPYFYSLCDYVITISKVEECQPKLGES